MTMDDDDDDDDDDDEECLARSKVWCVSSIDPTRTKCCGNAQAICLTHANGNVDCGTHAGLNRPRRTWDRRTAGNPRAARVGSEADARVTARASPTAEITSLH